MRAPVLGLCFFVSVNGVAGEVGHLVVVHAREKQIIDRDTLKGEIERYILHI